MTIFTGAIRTVSEKYKSNIWLATQILIGSLFLFVCAQISIPLYPVPMTMQTFGVFSLAMMQGGKKACCSTILYIALATLGVPVLAGGHSGICWWLSPTAGYVAAFPIAAFVIGKMVKMQHNPSSLWIIFTVLIGKIIIYTFGILGLMRILSFQQSLYAGLIPFLPLAIVKIFLITLFNGLWLRFKQR